VRERFLGSVRRECLEQRLRAASPDGAQFARRRQLLVFDPRQDLGDFMTFEVGPDQNNAETWRWS